MSLVLSPRAGLGKETVLVSARQAWLWVCGEATVSPQCVAAGTTRAFPVKFCRSGVKMKAFPAILVNRLKANSRGRTLQ